MEKSADDGSSVGTTSESLNASWMEPEGHSSARQFDNDFRSLFPARLLVVSTDELTAPSVASLADGGPLTARQFLSDKELIDMLREIFKT